MPAQIVQAFGVAFEQHEDDPRGFVASFTRLNAAEARRQRAENTLIAWVVSLPDQREPAAATRNLLSAYDDALSANQENLRLNSFLKQTLEHSAPPFPRRRSSFKKASGFNA